MPEISPSLASVWSTSLDVWERLDFIGSGTVPAGADALVERWADVVGKGDKDLLERRLSWDGVSSGDIVRVLGTGCDIPLPVPAPEWVVLLEKALAFEGCAEGEVAERLSGCPFAELLFPFAAVGSERLTGLGGEAFEDVQVFLTERLHPLAAPTLYEAFDDFRSARGRDGAYRAFLADCRGGGVLRIFSAKPVLARALCELTLSAVDCLVEMLERLENDQERLGNPGVPVRLEPGVSDRHNGGRQVCAVTFADGGRFFYKPKSVSVDAAFHRLLGSFEEDCFPEPLEVIDGGGYGWVRHVGQATFSDRKAAAGYYRRTGGLLALLYALEGSDFIMDNIIAAAGGPAAIDCEAGLQPLCLPAASDGAGADALRDQLLRHRDFSVLDTGLLPFWQPSGGGGAHDISGLGGGGGYLSQSAQAHWEDVNTDMMERLHQPVAVGAEKNGVLVGGAVQEAGDYASEIVAGFSAAYHVLLERRQELLDGGGLEELFSGVQGRFLFRATQVYGQMLVTSSLPEALASGVRRGIEIEALLRPFVTRVRQRPITWELLKKELADLARWDVPYFGVAAEEKTYPHIVCTPLEMAQKRFARLDEDDLARQEKLVTNALLLKPRAPFVMAGEKPPPFAEDPVFWKEKFIAEARVLGEWLCSNGGVRNFDLTLSPGASHDGFSAVGETEEALLRAQEAFLYSGRAGFALFMSALGRVTGNATYSDLGKKQLVRAIDAVAALPAAARERLDPGATNGLASLVFAADAIEELGGDPVETRRAQTLFDEIFPVGELASCQVYDVTNGLAGAVLAMTGSGSRTGDVRGAVSACCERLLAARHQNSAASGPFWKMGPEIDYLGFAHGSAGVGAALARAAAVTGREDFAVVAAEVFALLAEHFPDPVANWPIGFNGAGPVQKKMEAWCHGTPGILLALLEIAEHRPETVDKARLSKLLTSGLGRLRAEPLHGIDDLCCGNFGRTEPFLRAAAVIPDQALLFHALATDLATRVLARRNVLGLYPLGARKSDAYLLSPGAFKSLSGIGYQLLRLADPVGVPSLLAFAV